MRKLERPRPLHPRSDSVAVPSSLGNLIHGTSLSYRHQAVPAEFGAFVNERGAVQIDVCNLLKESGARMKNAFKEELDRIFGLLRDDGIRDVERMETLEIVQLRAAGWKLNNGQAKDSSQNFGRANSVDLSLSYRHQTMPAELGAFINERVAVQIDRICNLLKERGARMENAFKEELGSIFGLLLDACRDEGISDVERMKILEIVQLRAAGWKLRKGSSHHV
ncbi:hypothetical protein V5799_004566 [Amblyomma americanum]|uniref:Uncharacterized protein n=1 Tax=Amblyomma americanum TaxID=6943 RepID=A0AAQ4D5R1_AMBAM